MDPAEYATMYNLEDTYWWFQGRHRIVTGLLESLPDFGRGRHRVLDMGCGTGLMLRHLADRGWPVGLDFSPLALEFSGKRGAGRLVRGDVTHAPFADASFDLVTALDLAEHVEDDGAFFSETMRVLEAGGHLVLTVPAHPFLWSEHDDALYHHRRYTRRAVRRRLREAGFEVQRLTFCITFTFPIIVGFRLLQRAFGKKDKPKTHHVILPGWANRLLMWSVRLEGFLLKWMNLPFGVTIAAVARKPQSQENETP